PEIDKRDLAFQISQFPCLSLQIGQSEIRQSMTLRIPGRGLGDFGRAFRGFVARQDCRSSSQSSFERTRRVLFSARMVEM
ncbi:MAG TPA: hypothetical protein VI479_01250, partial [Blastocatellia bacterium]